jgi:cytochrome P450
MLLSLVFITLLVYYISFRWKRRKLYALAKKIPGSDGLPFFGHAFTFMKIDVRNNINDSNALIQHNLPVSKIWGGSLLFIIVNSPDHSQAMLQSTACLKIPFIISRPFLHRYGLIIANGAVWQHHRKILSHSFKINILQQLMPIFNQKCSKFVDKLKPKVGAPQFEIGHFVAALTLETTMTGNFHYDHCFYGSKIIEDIDYGKTLMMKRMLEPWWNVEWLFQRSTLYKKMKASITLLDARIDEIIEAYKKNMNNNEHRGTFVIDQLMDPANNLSYEEIRDEIFIFIIAVSVNFVLYACVLYLRVTN